MTPFVATMKLLDLKRAGAALLLHGQVHHPAGDDHRGSPRFSNSSQPRPLPAERPKPLRCLALQPQSRLEPRHARHALARPGALPSSRGAERLVDQPRVVPHHGPVAPALAETLPSGSTTISTTTASRSSPSTREVRSVESRPGSIGNVCTPV